MNQHKAVNLIECKGNYYDIGWQYGEACRANIIKSLEGLVKGISLVHHVDKESILATARKYFPKIVVHLNAIEI